MTPEEAALQQAHQAFAKDCDDIVETGRGIHGTANFDEASQTVAEKLGAKAAPFMAIARGFDRPHDVVMHLANNPGRLEAFAKLSPERQAVELARIEGQLSSFGHVRTSADPAWKSPELRKGRVSDDQWRSNAGEGLSDAAWSREWDRRHREKGKR